MNYSYVRIYCVFYLIIENCVELGLPLQAKEYSGKIYSKKGYAYSIELSTRFPGLMSIVDPQFV
jgi:hypothetical protein